jgi:predicted ABC-type transport system involved in lysophospholipase L1 biosynthesis ATPase subunit
VDTKELTQKDEDDLKELVASTCHLINASNHVIVAVNMLDNIPPNQHLEGKSNSL